MKTRFERDMLLILIHSVLLLLSTYLVPIQFLLIPLGFTYVVFTPGYALAAALFPSKQELTVAKRLVLAVGLSIAVVPLLGFLLNFTTLGINLETILFSMLAFVLLSCFFAVYRRRRLPSEERFIVEFALPTPESGEKLFLDRFLSTLVAIGVAATVVGMAYAIAIPSIGESFTEFYLLGPNGAAGDYPAEVVANAPITLILGVVNNQYADVQYRLERVDDSGRARLASIQLRHGGKWEQIYTYSLSEPGPSQTVMFNLYVEGNDEPYRSLHLWIDVVEDSEE